MKRYVLFAACCAALLAVPMAVNSQQPGGNNADSIRMKMARTQRGQPGTQAQIQITQQPGGDNGGGGGRGGRGGRGGGGPGGFGGGPGGFGGAPGGGGMMGGDPMQFFDMISKGKDVIRRDELDPMFQRMFDRMAQSQGITNGQITRDQFRAVSEAARNRGGPGGPGGGPPGGGRGGDMNPEQMDRQAEDAFRKHDKDGDGQLQFTEMPDNLKSVWTNYDHNKDGSINLEEYKSFYRDRIQIRLQENAQVQVTIGQSQSADGLPPEQEAVPVQDDDKRPTVYRYGKMPKELPPWFTELDTYKDGQIWLSSWIKAGKSVEEFRAMDRNDDGLITVEEYLGYVRATTAKSPGDTVLASAGGEERGGGRPGFGGFGGFGGPGGQQGMPFGGGRGRGGPGGGPGRDNGDAAGGGGMQGGGGRGNWGGGGPGGGGPGGMQGGGGRGNKGGGGPGGADAAGGGQTDGGGRRGGGRGGRGPGGGGNDRGNAPGNAKDSPKP